VAAPLLSARHALSYRRSSRPRSLELQRLRPMRLPQIASKSAKCWGAQPGAANWPRAPEPNCLRVGRDMTVAVRSGLGPLRLGLEGRVPAPGATGARRGGRRVARRGPRAGRRARSGSGRARRIARASSFTSSASACSSLSASSSAPAARTMLASSAVASAGTGRPASITRASIRGVVGQSFHPEQVACRTLAARWNSTAIGPAGG